MLERRAFTNDIELLLNALPTHITASILNGEDEPADLLEIVMDLGRLPEARYRDKERFLSDREVTLEEIRPKSSVFAFKGTRFRLARAASHNEAASAMGMLSA